MDSIKFYRPGLHDVGYTFGGMEAVENLEPGTLFEVCTFDCFGGAVRSLDDLPSQVCRPPYLNPVSGPFFVRGAEPGDTLAVHIVALAPTGRYGLSTTFPHFGALTGTGTLQPALEERVWVFEYDAPGRTLRYQARNSGFSVDLPMEPMIGSIGVSPGLEAVSTLTAGRHGGNLDTTMMRPGTTLYLGVNQLGAMLALGDGHARQGVGEIGGVAVETGMHTTFVVEVIKGVPTQWPRLETDELLASLGCGRPLEDAVRISQLDLVRWVQELTGLDELDAYQLVSQAGSAVVGNVCNPVYTMLASIPKALMGATAYGDTHQRLRALTAGVTVN